MHARTRVVVRNCGAEMYLRDLRSVNFRGPSVRSGNFWIASYPSS